MFTSIEDLPFGQQTEVLASLDAVQEWEATWDIGLADHGDTFPVMPKWGVGEVAGRWPVVFALGRDHQRRPWRQISDAHPGYGCPRSAMAVSVEQIGGRDRPNAGRAPIHAA